MTVLSDRSIKEQEKLGNIKIDPYDEANVQPASIDVHLDEYFRVLNPHEAVHIDPYVDQSKLMHSVKRSGDKPFVIHPGDFVLGSTLEHMTLPPNIVGRLEGKSSLARLGLLIHTAGYIDPGFSGHVTLELGNNTPLPLLLYPGMKIGQMAFSWLDHDAEHPYGSKVNGSKYQGQRGPTASRYYLNPRPTPSSSQ